MGDSKVAVVVGEDQNLQLRETGSQASVAVFSLILFWSSVAKTAVRAPTAMMIGKGFTLRVYGAGAEK